MATFSTAGTYVLALTASDGSLQSTDQVSIQVQPAVAQDTTPPTVTGVAPSSGSSTAAVNSAVTVSFSEQLDATTVNLSTIFLRDASGTVIPTSLAYNAATNTVTLTPTAALANSTTYTLVVKGGAAGVKDTSGNALAADATSSFTTVAAAQPFVTSSLWSGSTSPSVADSGDGSAVELGVKFSATTSGYITGLRFYKSAANTGTHKANLWSRQWTTPGHSHLYQRDRQRLAAGQLLLAGRHHRRHELYRVLLCPHRPLLGQPLVLQLSVQQWFAQGPGQRRCLPLRHRRIPFQCLPGEQLLGRRRPEHHPAGRQHRADHHGLRAHHG